MNQVSVKYRNPLERFNSRNLIFPSLDAAVNDDHEPFGFNSHRTEYGRIKFKFSENGQSLSDEYEGFMRPSSVSMELGLEYLEREKSIIRLCELIKPAQIDIKQGQETCKGGYKKFGWWLLIDDEKTSFQYRVGGIVKWSKVIS